MYPKISVVTVVFNDVDHIEETMLSVLNQSYSYIEYIVIDGNSTDGTVEIIKKYASQISYWISEPDRGIYDAMNKGIAQVTGEWINFMNAGDRFVDEKVIENVFIKNYPPSCEVIYGKTRVFFPWGIYVVTPPDLRMLRSRMCLCHQSTFIRVSVQKERYYNLSCKIVADYNFFHSVYIEKPFAFIFYPDIIADYDAVGGLSAQNKNGVQCEMEKVIGRISLVQRMKQYLLGNLPVKLVNIAYRVYFCCHLRYKRVASA